MKNNLTVRWAWMSVVLTAAAAAALVSACGHQQGAVPPAQSAQLAPLASTQPYTIEQNLPPPSPTASEHLHRSLHLADYNDQPCLEDNYGHRYDVCRDSHGSFYPAYYDRVTDRYLPLYYDGDRDNYYCVAEDPSDDHFCRHYVDDPDYERYYYDDVNYDDYQPPSWDCPVIYTPPSFYEGDYYHHHHDWQIDIPLITVAVVLLDPGHYHPNGEGGWWWHQNGGWSGPDSARPRFASNNYSSNNYSVNNTTVNNYYFSGSYPRAHTNPSVFGTGAAAPGRIAGAGRPGLGGGRAIAVRPAAPIQPAGAGRPSFWAHRTATASGAPTTANRPFPVANRPSAHPIAVANSGRTEGRSSFGRPISPTHVATVGHPERQHPGFNRPATSPAHVATAGRPERTRPAFDRHPIAAVPERRPMTRPTTVARLQNKPYVPERRYMHRAPAARPRLVNAIPSRPHTEPMRRVEPRPVEVSRPRVVARPRPSFSEPRPRPTTFQPRPQPRPEFRPQPSRPAFHPQAAPRPQPVFRPQQRPNPVQFSRPRPAPQPVQRPRPSAPPRPQPQNRGGDNRDKRQ